MSTFAHRVYLWVSYDNRNKQRLFPWSGLTTFSCNWDTISFLLSRNYIKKICRSTSCFKGLTFYNNDFRIFCLLSVKIVSSNNVIGYGQRTGANSRVYGHRQPCKWRLHWRFRELFAVDAERKLLLSLHIYIYICMQTLLIFLLLLLIIIIIVIVIIMKWAYSRTSWNNDSCWQSFIIKVLQLLTCIFPFRGVSWILVWCSSKSNLFMRHRTTRWD
jgi:hypothetical protein